MRLIDANRVLNDIGLYMAENAYLNDTALDALKKVADWVEDAPTIEAEPVVHGEWIHDINNLYGCSLCMERETMSHKRLKPYCPNCGAKIKGAKHEQTTA